MLPNLLVIGAAKCGTTSLHAYLDAHPEISMSREKELNFFVEEKNWSRGIDWYASQFAAASVRGESSVAYTAFPHYDGVAERIASTLPSVRLVYLVRDPIERIVSHYLHHSISYPSGTIEEALSRPDLARRLIDVSRYWLQLERYLPHVPAERILVVDSHELRFRREPTLTRTFEFLGVDPTFRSPSFDDRHNSAVGQTRRNSGGELALRGLERLIGRERTSNLAGTAPAVLKAPLRRQVDRPALSPELRARLAEALRDDVERLRAHTGQEFASWSL